MQQESGLQNKSPDDNNQSRTLRVSQQHECVYHRGPRFAASVPPKPRGT